MAEKKHCSLSQSGGICHKCWAGEHGVGAQLGRGSAEWHQGRVRAVQPLGVQGTRQHWQKFVAAGSYWSRCVLWARRHEVVIRWRLWGWAVQSVGETCGCQAGQMRGEGSSRNYTVGKARCLLWGKEEKGDERASNTSSIDRSTYARYCPYIIVCARFFLSFPLFLYHGLAFCRLRFQHLFIQPICSS